MGENGHLFSHLNDFDQMPFRIADESNLDAVLRIIPHGVDDLASCVHRALHARVKAIVSKR